MTEELKEILKRLLLDNKLVLNSKENRKCIGMDLIYAVKGNYDLSDDECYFEDITAGFRVNSRCVLFRLTVRNEEYLIGHLETPGEVSCVKIIDDDEF